MHGGFVEPGARAAKPRAPAPISSQFFCPRPPLLLSNQNRNATQAKQLQGGILFKAWAKQSNSLACLTVTSSLSFNFI